MSSKFAAAPMSLFGYGARKDLPALLAREGVKRALVITDQSLQKLGICGKVCEVLEAANLEYVIFDEVQPNPTLENVNDGVRLMNGEHCDFLIAVGGGSANDCAKAIRLLAAGGGTLRDYQGGNKGPAKGALLVAVNTTAGTGSEVSRAYLISDTEEKRKLIFKDDYAMPSIAVNDTELMENLPPHITAQTGMDALTHAVESFSSTGRYLLSDLLAEDAMKLIFTNLPSAVEHPENRQAREAMAYGQYLAGLSFGNAGLGLVHAMAHQLGGTYNLPHGLCNAVLLPWVMEFNLEAAKEPYAKIAELLHPEGCEGRNQQERASYAVELIRSLSRRVGTDVPLKSLGVKEEDIEEMAGKALLDGCILSSPVMPTKEQVMELYQGAM